MLYFGYLGAIKEQNGAANSIGRIAEFMDIYIQRDIEEGILDEVHAQELIDDLVIKLRLVRHLRTPEYNDLFAGDPVWVTMALAGVTCEGKHMVSKTHTVYCRHFTTSVHRLSRTLQFFGLTDFLRTLRISVLRFPLIRTRFSMRTTT